jgi:hypothetical protein
MSIYRQIVLPQSTHRLWRAQSNRSQRFINLLSLPDKRNMGKANITDRINGINKIYIKNPDNPVNPVENQHEKFFVSGTEIYSAVSAVKEKTRIRITTIGRDYQ